MIKIDHIKAGATFKQPGKNKIYTLIQMPLGWCLADLIRCEGFGFINTYCESELQQKAEAANYLEEHGWKFIL